MSNKTIITFSEEDNNDDVCAKANLDMMNAASRYVAASQNNGKPITKLDLEVEKGYGIASVSTKEEGKPLEIQKFGTNTIETTETICLHRRQKKKICRQ